MSHRGCPAHPEYDLRINRLENESIVQRRDHTALTARLMHLAEKIEDTHKAISNEMTGLLSSIRTLVLEISEPKGGGNGGMGSHDG